MKYIVVDDDDHDDISVPGLFDSMEEALDAIKEYDPTISTAESFRVLAVTAEYKVQVELRTIDPIVGPCFVAEEGDRSDEYSSSVEALESLHDDDYLDLSRIQYMELESAIDSDMTVSVGYELTPTLYNNYGSPNDRSSLGVPRASTSVTEIRFDESEDTDT